MTALKKVHTNHGSGCERLVTAFPINLRPPTNDIRKVSLDNYLAGCVTILPMLDSPDEGYRIAKQLRITQNIFYIYGFIAFARILEYLPNIVGVLTK